MQIYADNAATTKMSRTAIDAMLPYMETYYGNPSSLHTVGQQAAEALERSRSSLNVLICLRRPYRRAEGQEAHHLHRLRASRHPAHPEEAGKRGLRRAAAGRGSHRHRHRSAGG